MLLSAVVALGALAAFFVGALLTFFTLLTLVPDTISMPVVPPSEASVGGGGGLCGRLGGVLFGCHDFCFSLFSVRACRSTS